MQLSNANNPFDPSEGNHIPTGDALCMLVSSRLVFLFFASFDRLFTATIFVLNGYIIITITITLSSLYFT